MAIEEDGDNVSVPLVDPDPLGATAMVDNNTISFISTVIYNIFRSKTYLDADTTACAAPVDNTNKRTRLRILMVALISV